MKVEVQLIVVNFISIVHTTKEGKVFDKVTIVGDILGEPGKKLAVSAFGKNASTFKTMSIDKGQQIKVTIDLSSREWNGKWINSFDIIELEFMGEFTGGTNMQELSPFESSVEENPFSNSGIFSPSDNQNDGLPF
jgi:hypothetical protein